MALGEPDAGKPPVRFDEGRSETVIGLCLSIRPLRLLYLSNSAPERSEVDSTGEHQLFRGVRHDIWSDDRKFPRRDPVKAT